MATNPPGTSEFLKQAKDAIRSKNREILDKRSNFRNTLAYLGITIDDVWMDLLSLTEHDRWRCDPDDNGSFGGDVWKTKKRLHGEIIYIKLKIKSTTSGQLLVMSYHIDEPY